MWTTLTVQSDPISRTIERRRPMDVQSAELREGLLQLLQALSYVTKAENTRGPLRPKGDRAGKVLHIDVEELRQQGSATRNKENPELPLQPGDLHPVPRDEREKALGEHMRSPSFKSERNAVGKFLSLLSCLHRENLEQFPFVERFNGRALRYSPNTTPNPERSQPTAHATNIPISGNSAL